LKQVESKHADMVNELVWLCHSRAKDMGWHDKPREIGTDLALIHSEVSEALEGFRKNLMDDHLKQYPMPLVELADTVIRCFDTVGKVYGYNALGKAFTDKLIYNAERPDHKKENRESEKGKKF
tara:strand:- start:58220 stop:58588 length:369 start_codon:yes stop_codon:yes gene_type:complete